MNPSMYSAMYTFIEEDNEITGLRISKIDMDVLFYEKID